MKTTFTISILIRSASSFVPMAPRAISGSALSSSPAANSEEDLELTVKAITQTFEPNTVIPEKPVFDPLGLYPNDSPEREDDLIQPLESSTDAQQAEKYILDPLQIYRDDDEVSIIEMSKALPFLERPALLDGKLPGDLGFDPFNFAQDEDSLQWQRKAELKHSRLAMLACVGWPIAELLHNNIATAYNLPSLLASNDRVPSALNGALLNFPLFLVVTVAVAAVMEFQETAREDADGIAGVFDPLGYIKGRSTAAKRFMQEGEIANGRIAMLAITGFAVQEWFLNAAVVDQSPWFFGW